jgi:hypothetical protein
MTLDDLPGKVRIAEEFKPRGECEAIYREMFREFLCSFKANRGTFARLGRLVKAQS